MSSEEFEHAFRIGASINQDYKLPTSTLGAYEGFIGNSPVQFELYWMEDKTVIGRAGQWNITGINSREGELNLRAFFQNKEIGKFNLNKIVDKKIVTWTGEFIDENRFTTSASITRLPNSDEYGSLHAFGDEADQLKHYMMWIGNESVFYGLMGGFKSLPLSRAGDLLQPNIEVLDNLTNDISSGIVYLDKKIIFVGHGKSITALDTETGGKIWSVNLPIFIYDDGLKLSTDGNFIYALGGSASEVFHISSLWRVPINGSGEALELLRTWRSGSEGGLPAAANIARHIPGTDKFIVEIKDMQNTYFFASRGQSCGHRLFFFDAVEMSLRKCDASQVAFPAFFTSQAPESTYKDPTTEDFLLSCVQSPNPESKTVKLIKRPNFLELFVSNGTYKTTMHQWPLSPEGETLRFTDGMIESIGTSGSPIVLGVANDPSHFMFSERIIKNGGHRRVGQQASESQDFEILARAEFFGLHIEITNKHTRKTIFDSVKNGLPIQLQPVSYMESINFKWLDQARAVMALPTGQFLLVDCSKPKPLELLSSEGLPQSTDIFCNSKENTISIISSSRIYKSLLDIKNNFLKPEYFVSFDRSGPNTIVFSDNLYSSIGGAIKSISAATNNRALPFEQFDLRLNRPDIVLERLGAPDEAIAIAKQLREKRLKRMGVTEDMLKPDFHLPEVEIVGDLPSTTTESEVALKIKASDSKYPLDRLRVYVNNVPVNGKEGELLRPVTKADGLLGRLSQVFSETPSGQKNLERTMPIKLAAGRNKIQISVLNSAGAESLYANAEVICTAQRPKPTLYAVAMGVSEYANPEWNLKYAAKDARDILERINTRTGSSYGEIKELLITDREATKESLGKIRNFLSTATVDDTVLLFVAGHGLLDSKYDYYFGTSDIEFDNPSANGIAFEEFDDLLAELPCLRKSLLIDTCHAGELDEDEKKMLASAQANPSQVVAMLPTGARGMTIKPIEGARGKSEWYDRLQSLFVDLRRGSGSTILSSSAGAEYALESSEQKNGLFTYAVLEALDGKEGSDANKDGSVTMSELADYVKTRVAALTNNKQSPNVRRVNLEGDFALSKK